MDNFWTVIHIGRETMIVACAGIWYVSNCALLREIIRRAKWS